MHHSRSLLVAAALTVYYVARTVIFYPGSPENRRFVRSYGIADVSSLQTVLCGAWCTCWPTEDAGSPVQKDELDLVSTTKTET